MAKVKIFSDSEASFGFFCNFRDRNAIVCKLANETLYI
jgi:hypothetical protein